MLRRWSGYHAAMAAEKNDFVESTRSEVPPAIQPINSPLTLVQRGTYSPSNRGLDDMEDITPPLAPGFEDLNAPLAQKADISLHRSAIEILQMWYESSRTSLIVLFLFSSRSYYKFTWDNVLQLRSTINLFSKDHNFMTLHENIVRTVNNGPEHINEHATYLREACHQLQAVDKGRQNQVPWNIVQQYIASTIALAGKVLRQPPMSDILHHVQDAVKCTQNIQRDVSIIKNSWWPNSCNMGAAQSARTTKTQSTVTAYKDRAVTVRLKDHGIAQRFRTLPAIKIKQQVETSIKNHAVTKSVEVVAAHQLKSGDIQIFTSSTAEAVKLKQNREWVSGLGEHAELIVPTYGVITHGISTSTINIKDQKATIQQILADNYTVIPKAEISYVGWLTRESPLKRASSIVVEFTDPEMANAIIYAGMAWDGQIHTCQLYDRACRVKQCCRCHNYGHIGTQCDAAQTCGCCAELHETRNCTQKGVEGFTPSCPVCKGAHTAWSNACPARRKELGRVEQAKQVRNTYWQVAPKDEPPENSNPRKRPRHARSPTPNEIITIVSPREEPSDHTVPTREPPQAQEDRAAPAPQQEPQQPAIDPQLLATGQPQETGPAAGDTPNMETRV
ncbi:hypothetical protein PAAG_08760 [Paracoccidioides lutzii Pb01]|uniref:CCHC-type domain-containing protein n=1 Tax=Paracoccidioides lutzii (strain ATCC MYA-826 / Pb01) TaxID=502779 RepID=C1HDB9_PARBA|nr:hypothetical protein PAAG_08760 [Paracoccidioides lutzii Pb01]EEH39491.2 hypothetical protein PAAG_08760 [Paracoccidioides lutzii Pb01]